MKKKNSIERKMLMTLLNCDLDGLALISRLFKRFKKRFGINIIPIVMSTLDDEYTVSSVVWSLIYEVLELLNRKYNTNLEILGMDYDETGFRFDQEYLDLHLAAHGLDADTIEYIKYEINSWCISLK